MTAHERAFAALAPIVDPLVEMGVTLEWLRLKLIVDEAPGPATAREFIVVEGYRFLTFNRPLSRTVWS